jgi:carbamoyl-phosphate synthase small subunit
MRSLLVLEDGTVFTGTGFGAGATAVGEVVFHTGMTGYQEILTDPSYKGQIVTMTAPHIGNTGVNREDVESDRPRPEGFVVRELCRTPSNHRSTQALDGYLAEHGLPGIEGVDTRALTRHLRERGSMMGILSNEGLPVEALRERLRAAPSLSGQDLVRRVTADRPMEWPHRADAAWYGGALRPGTDRVTRVVAYDFGIKWNILRLLSSFGMAVTLVPASTPAAEVLERKPDGVFLSNGPGDPEAVPYAAEAVRGLAGRLPLFGICLGHQILALAFGARTFKLKFGHHGSNHPVRDEATRAVEITSQNHNFAVEPESLRRAGFTLTHVNLNDGTVEGMRHRDLPIASVQYHPEASPGPHDSLGLFRTFIGLIETA